MFGPAWLGLTLVLLVASAATGEAPLYLVTLLLFFTGGIVRLWSRYLFARVEYAQRLTGNRVFLGDPVTLEVQVTNAKVLPLPWLRLEVDVPQEVECAPGLTLPSSKPLTRVLPAGLSLTPYQRVTRRYPLRCGRRGYFTFGPVRLEAGDLFGFFRRRLVIERSDPLIVYPRILPLDRLGIPSKELFGDIRVRRHLFEDPVRVAAVRDYVPGDPLKRVHWKSSARLGKLQSKVFEPTTSADAAIFLDCRTVRPPMWGYVEELLELGVLTAASVASHALERDMRVGLYINQSLRRTDRLVQIPPSSHPDQLIHILEALAQVHPQELFSIDKLVARHARALPWETTVLVITAAPTPDLLTLLAQLRRAGRSIALVVPGASTAHALPSGLPAYCVPLGGDWQAVEGIAIERAA